MALPMNCPSVCWTRARAFACARDVTSMATRQQWSESNALQARNDFAIRYCTCFDALVNCETAVLQKNLVHASTTLKLRRKPSNEYDHAHSHPIHRTEFGSATERNLVKNNLDQTSFFLLLSFSLSFFMLWNDFETS